MEYWHQTEKDIKLVSMFTKYRKSYRKWQGYKKSIRKESWLKWLVVELAETLLVALPLALLVRHFVIQTSVVPTPSMVPTVMVGDRLFVNKYIYRFTDPERGDLVVFRLPGEENDWVKRCIGLPGEEITIKDGSVYINGKLLIIPGVNVLRSSDTQPPVVVPPNSYYVLGDNRGNSNDSRIWGFVRKQDLLGEAVFTFWPLNRMRVIR